MSGPNVSTWRLPVDVDRNTDACIDRLLASLPTSWDGEHHTATVTPWWWSGRDDNLSTLAVALLLAITAIAVVACGVIGQDNRRERCERAATTATPCGVHR